jgi:hypothetical protein
MNSLALTGDPGLSAAQRREWERQLNQIERIGSLTVKAAGQTNQTIKEVTRGAITELRAINTEIVSSNLPAAQQQQLRRQVSDALMKHERLLAIASQRAQQELMQATQPLPPRSGLEALSDEIDDALHALTGGFFRRR